MPTYEYVCEKCGYDFDAFQRITAEPLTTCPKCGGQLVRKINGGAGLVFKGSGFYETDYKHKNPQATKKKETEKKGS